MEFGPYRIENVLGRGGMGTVYRAFDTRRERPVALKVLAEHLVDDATFRERFRREAQAAAQLGDPHVVPIHDFGEIDGRLFLDMRLVTGTDLGALLDDGPLVPDRAVALLGQLAEALDAAHATGLVHRDVKPSNVLVTASDFVYLVDFGIARSVREERTALTTTGSALGTLAYMAPERFDGAAPDVRADVYALACVLHEMLTGERPFGSDAVAAIRGHLMDPPPRPSARAPVPPALDDVVAWGMAKAPARRPTSAGTLAAAAREGLAGHAPGVQGAVPTVVPGARPPSGSIAPWSPARPGAAPSAPSTLQPPRGAPSWPPATFRPAADPPPAVGPPGPRRRALPWLVGGLVAVLGVLAAVLLMGGSAPVGSDMSGEMVGTWQGNGSDGLPVSVTVSDAAVGARAATVRLPTAGCSYGGTRTGGSGDTVELALSREGGAPGACVDGGPAVLNLAVGGATLTYRFTYPSPGSGLFVPDNVARLSRVGQ